MELAAARASWVAGGPTTSTTSAGVAGGGGTDANLVEGLVGRFGQQDSETARPGAASGPDTTAGARFRAGASRSSQGRSGTARRRRAVGGGPGGTRWQTRPRPKAGRRPGPEKTGAGWRGRPRAGAGAAESGGAESWARRGGERSGGGRVGGVRRRAAGSCVSFEGLQGRQIAGRDHQPVEQDPVAVTVEDPHQVVACLLPFRHQLADQAGRGDGVTTVGGCRPRAAGVRAGRRHLGPDPGLRRPSPARPGLLGPVLQGRNSRKVRRSDRRRRVGTRAWCTSSGSSSRRTPRSWASRRR